MTMNETQRSRERARLAAASKARSRSLSSGRRTDRRSTLTWGGGRRSLRLRGARPLVPRRPWRRETEGHGLRRSGSGSPACEPKCRYFGRRLITRLALNQVRHYMEAVRRTDCGVAGPADRGEP